MVSLFQFDFVGRMVRKRLGKALKELHFTTDHIAFFDIPALEIDTEVDGLMVVRGISISISRLTAIAHGVEVGIKLSDDMELALQVDKVTLSLFRKIEIGDVYCNLKGGEYEMTFGHLAESSHDSNGSALMNEDTPLLRAAGIGPSRVGSPRKISMVQKMVDGAPPEDAIPELDLLTTLTPADEKARQRYQTELDRITETSAIEECRIIVQKITRRATDMESKSFDTSDVKDMRAAICSYLHDKPTVPHPPLRSIKVTTLQNLSSPRTRKLMHRLPFLLRLLLWPLSAFHPIYISSITAGGSGKWLKHMLSEFVFKQYGEDDAIIRKLEARVSSWLENANFVLELTDINGGARVPLSTIYPIEAKLSFDDVMAYRTLPKEIDLRQVVRLGGADCAITVPSFLLPHHEHLLPPEPTKESVEEQIEEVRDADGLPKTFQAKQDLAQLRKDETNLKMSVHGRLPAVFDQHLLDFVAALVKATKIIEMEKDPHQPDPLSSPSKDSLIEPDTVNDVDSIAEDEEPVEDDASVLSVSPPKRNNFDLSMQKLRKTKTWGRTFYHSNLSNAESIPDDASMTSPVDGPGPAVDEFGEILSKRNSIDVTIDVTAEKMKNLNNKTRTWAKDLGAKSKALNSNIRDSMKRVAIDAVANDRWIAKLVGKVTKSLETAVGEIGYSGNIPVSLAPYRALAERETKLLP